MATATQAPTPTPGAMVPADQSKNIDAILDKQIEYVPFLSEQQISLTPRMVIRFMCKPTKSGKRATLEQALHFCMLCKARGLNPWEGDAFLVGYDTADGPEFSLITAHQAFLKRAEIHPEYDGMKSGVIVKRGDDVIEEEGDFYMGGDDLLGGWAKVLFKTRTNPVYKRLRLSTFNKGFGRWKVDPAGMIVKCAEADALRSAFPNSLGGMYLEDEMPGKSSGEEGGATNGSPGEVENLRAKTVAKTAELKERLNAPVVIDAEAIQSGGPNETDSEHSPETAESRKARETTEKKRVRASIQEKTKDLGWDEKRIDQFFGGRDINAFSLKELTELDQSLDEIKSGA